MGRRKSNIWTFYIKVNDSHVKCKNCHYGLYPNSTKMKQHFQSCKGSSSATESLTTSVTTANSPQEIDLDAITVEEITSQSLSR